VSRFEEWLKVSGLGIEVMHFADGTRTARDAARAVGCEVGQIVKSLVFVAGGQPVVVLASGADRVDLAKLGLLAGGEPQQADPDTARDATGYSIGGVPPFGHARRLPVFMDRDLLQYPVVWAAAGRPDAVFEIEPGRLQELSSALVGDLA